MHLLDIALNLKITIRVRFKFDTGSGSLFKVYLDPEQDKEMDAQPWYRPGAGTPLGAQLVVIWSDGRRDTSLQDRNW